MTGITMALTHVQVRALRRLAGNTDYSTPIKATVLGEQEHRRAVKRTALTIGGVFLFAGLFVAVLLAVLSNKGPHTDNMIGVALLISLGLGLFGYFFGYWMTNLNHSRNAQVNVGLRSIAADAQGLVLEPEQGKPRQLSWSKLSVLHIPIYKTKYGPVVKSISFGLHNENGDDSVLTIDAILLDNGQQMLSYLANRLLDHR